MGNCNFSADENGFDLNMDMKPEQLLFLAAQRKTMDKNTKTQLDKSIKAHVMKSVLTKEQPASNVKEPEVVV